MQSRRHEDFDYDRRRRDGYSAVSPRSKRSWSPRKVEGFAYPERSVPGGRRSVSLERRGFDGGGRNVRVRSRSPLYMETKRGRAVYKEDWVSDRDLTSPERRARYEFFEYVDRKHDDVDYSSPVRRFDSGGIRELPSQKPVGMGLYKSAGDMGPRPGPGPGAKTETGSASLNVGLGQIGKERVHYPDVRDLYSFDKFASMKHFVDDGKSMVHPRDMQKYSNLTGIRSEEEPTGASHFKDYARTSPRKSRVDPLDYRGGISFSRDNPPLSHSRYEQRQQHLDVHRDAELDVNDDVAPYREERFSPSRTGRLDSFRLRTREKDEYLYPSDEIYEKMDLHKRVDYNGRDTLTPSLLDRVAHRAEPSDIGHRNMSGRRSLDRIPLTATNNIGLSRSPAEKRELQLPQYFDPVSIHSRLGRKVTREDEMPYMGMAQDRETERSRVDFDYERGLSPGTREERMRSFQGFLYERERKMEDRDLPSYDSSSRYLKRKYTMEDEDDRIPSRNMMSRFDTGYRRRDRDFRDEEWMEQDAGRSRISERTHKVYDDDEFVYDPDEFVHDHEYHRRSYKYDDERAKGYSRSGGRGGYSSYHPNRRNFIPRWKNAPRRSENEKDAGDMYSSEIDQYEPKEDTKEFKQLVNDYFLSFTKKLYENSVVRRRYVEQGRAGSLFCIVCGGSLSKEFLDTQRLAMHAFMSHKSGLRAQHLGLLKAVCVMLGWNSVIPADSPRWFPDPISTTEALAQRQDLIIWPPVVIVHNTSIVSNSSKGEGPTSVEALGQYLRGLGLSGGKVKLGKPANCSVMLVKFLGTFSGLQDAEKIHDHFVKKRHGRKHYDQISSSKGKSNREESADKEAERVLFGYMGIAEDLDKVDIDTKRKCTIKSKKEIQDIADAPVKPGE